jgi:hypothetical protein
MIINLGNAPENNINVVAILSTAVMPIDGTYRIVTLKDQARSIVLNNLDGIQHYIGHPDTRSLVEALGSIKAPSNLFSGLQVGESIICFPIKQGQSTRATEGYTAHQAISDLENLDVRVLTRIE